MNLHPDSIEKLLIAANDLKDVDGRHLGSTMMYKVLSNEFLREYVQPTEEWINKMLYTKEKNNE